MLISCKHGASHFESHSDIMIFIKSKECYDNSARAIQKPMAGHALGTNQVGFIPGQIALMTLVEEYEEIAVKPIRKERNYAGVI